MGGRTGNSNRRTLGKRRDNAIDLEYMGYGYLRRGDYDNAYGVYEAAAEHYCGTVDEELDKTVTACKDNMEKIKENFKLEDR